MAATTDIPTYAQLMARTDAPAGSSWGVFGADDEIGTVNFITPERVRAAAGLIRRGVQFNLDRAIGDFDPPTSHQRKPHQHTIFGNNAHHRDDYIDSFYLQGTTQIDALRHMSHPIHGFYNAAPTESLTVGSPRNGISRWAERGGIVGRGVLIDVDRYLCEAGRPLDQRAGTAIDLATLEAARQAQGVQMQPGDIVMIRTGWLKFYFETMSDADRANVPKQLSAPGLLQSRDTLAWLWDHQVAVIAADNVGVEAIPPDASSPFAAELAGVDDVRSEFQARLMHPQLIAMLGLVLGELWDLEALAEDSARDGVWESFVSIKPLNLVGGVGSPANAVAIK